MLDIISAMTIRQIYFTNTRTTIALRGVIAICVGLLLAAIWSIATDTNAFRRFAFPIFGVPVTLTVINLLLTLGEQKNEKDKREDA
jgi:hypothetical protein